MPVQIIRAGRALTSSEEIMDAAVVIEDGVIVAVGRREEIVAPKGAKDHDARIHILVPGFVDVHIHGAGARDVMEATPEALKVVATTVARHGTTSLVATTVTAPTDEICHSLEGIARYIQSTANQMPSDAPLAQMTGIHLEGPFLSHLRRGGEPPRSLGVAPPATLKRLLQAAKARPPLIS